MSPGLDDKTAGLLEECVLSAMRSCCELADSRRPLRESFGSAAAHATHDVAVDVNGF